MFCHKCGNKIADGADFCHKCGTRVIHDNEPASASTTPEQTTSAAAQQQDKKSLEPKKKKPKKLWIGIGIAVVAVVVIVAIALSGGGKEEPSLFDMAEDTALLSELGFEATCGEVIDWLIEDQRTNFEQDGDVAYLTYLGTVSGGDAPVSLTLQVTGLSVNAETQRLIPYAMTLNGKEVPDFNNPRGALMELFWAHKNRDEYGYDTFMDYVHWDEENGVGFFSPYFEGSGAAGIDNGILTETFSDPVTGISFRYPSTWVKVDSRTEFHIAEFVDSENTAEHIAKFDVWVADPAFDVFSGDRAAIEKAVNEYHAFIDYGDAMLGDIPAKVLQYRSEGLRSENIVTEFYYMIGGETYRVSCSFATATEDIYNPVFQAIMESYAINSSENTDVTEGSFGYAGDPNDVSYRGQSLASFVGSGLERLSSYFGEPIGGTHVDGSLYSGGEYVVYEGNVIFVLDGDAIAWILGPTSAIEINGVTLDKSREEITELLGTPDKEENVFDDMTEEYTYYMTYYLEVTDLLVELPDADSKSTNFVISRVLGAED